MSRSLGGPSYGYDWSFAAVTVLLGLLYTFYTFYDHIFQTNHCLMPYVVNLVISVHLVSPAHCLFSFWNSDTYMQSEGKSRGQALPPPWPRTDQLSPV